VEQFIPEGGSVTPLATAALAEENSVYGTDADAPHAPQAVASAQKPGFSFPHDEVVVGTFPGATAATDAPVFNDLEVLVKPFFHQVGRHKSKDLVYPLSLAGIAERPFAKFLHTFINPAREIPDISGKFLLEADHFPVHEMTGREKSSRPIGGAFKTSARYGQVIFRLEFFSSNGKAVSGTPGVGGENKGRNRSIPGRKIFEKGFKNPGVAKSVGGKTYPEHLFAQVEGFGFFHRTDLAGVSMPNEFLPYGFRQKFRVARSRKIHDYDIHALILLLPKGRQRNVCRPSIGAKKGG
jgi:hypothetical protein